MKTPEPESRAGFIELRTDGEVYDCQGGYSPPILIYANNVTVRNFIIEAPNFKTGVRIYGDNCLVENGEIFNTLEDGMWVWGRNNTVRNIYIHGLLQGTTADGKENHTDGFMSFDWTGYNNPENLLIEGCTIELERVPGDDGFENVSNQFMIFTNETFSGTIRNNTMITSDPGYCPISFFDVAGDVSIIANTIINKSNQGSAATWFQDSPINAIVSTNDIYGYTDTIYFSNSPNVSSFANVLEEYKPDLCVRVTWDKNTDEAGLNVRPGPSMYNTAYRSTYLGPGFVFEPVEVVTNDEGTFAKVTEPNGWIAMKLNSHPGRVYAEFVECE